MTHHPFQESQDRFFSEDSKRPASNSQKITHPSWESIKNHLYLLGPKESFHLLETVGAELSSENILTIYVGNMIEYQILVNDFIEQIERSKSALGLDYLSIRIGIQEESHGNKHGKNLSLGNIKKNPLLNKDIAIQDSALSSGFEISTPFLESDFPEYEQKGTESSQEGEDQLQKDESPSSHPDNFTALVTNPSKLNPLYTFESFIKGPSNQFALASCQSIAENLGASYNPLFLYGSTGLGKTHLLHAVGNWVLAKNPKAIVSYISSERFMNEMIYCIRHNKMWDFRQKYRHCDVFMMDDIQFISGNKAATQEEFFHTFNTLYDAKKQIVITSDLFPQDIPEIEERLRNRFQWGLIADIQPPDVEHRIAILMVKAEKLGIRLSTDVAEYIANQAKRNIRELEGALHRIAAFAALQGRPVTKALALETFCHTAQDNGKKVSIESIQKLVAEHFKIKVTDLKSSKRHRALSFPRQLAMYLARQHTGTSFFDLGEKFGGKDHTTVMHGVKKIEKERQNDLDLRAHLETLERFIEQMI